MPRYVITGMSGTGKTALLGGLRGLGYTGFDEPARAVLEAGVPHGDAFAPAFVTAMLERAVRDFGAARDSGTTFFDRGVPDIVAYARRFETSDAAPLHVANELRYDNPMFITPPWEAIFVPDEYRRASFDEYVVFHRALDAAYREAGYELLEVPRSTIAERVAFVLEHAVS